VKIHKVFKLQGSGVASFIFDFGHILYRDFFVRRRGVVWGCLIFAIYLI